jgi:outer membrane protein TolC
MWKFLMVTNWVLGILSLFPLSSYGAESPGSLTLTNAIETARNNSPELKKVELAADSSSWSQLEALSEHLPHLSVNGTHFLGAKYALLGVVFGGSPIRFPSAFPQTGIDIEASILLFDGFGAINRYRASLLESEAAQFELNYAKFKLEEWIQVKFEQVLAAQEFAKVADQNIQTLEQHLQLARASQHAGFSTNIDVLRIESQLEEARAEKILTSDNVAIARQALNEAMGVDKDERSLEGVLLFPDRNKIPANLTLDLSQRQDLQAQSHREQAQDRMSSAAGAFLFPRVTFFGVEQFYKYGNFDPVILPNDSFQNAYSFGFRLNWNLFDGGAAIARKARTGNMAKTTSENSRKLLISSPNEFDIWKRKYIYNAALFEARKRSVEKSAESVRLATLAVKAGSKTNSEALDAELELFRARAGVVRAQLDASEALANLELAVGHRL